MVTTATVQLLEHQMRKLRSRDVDDISKVTQQADSVLYSISKYFDMFAFLFHMGWCKPSDSGVNVQTQQVCVCVCVCVWFPLSVIVIPLLSFQCSLLIPPSYHLSSCTGIICVCPDRSEYLKYFVLFFIHSRQTWILFNEYWWIHCVLTINR